MKITEVTKHHTLLGLGVDAFWGGMNIAKFNSMPDDLKKLFMDNMGDHMARISGKTLDDGAARDTKWMKENGHTIYYLPPAEKKRWLAKVKGMHEDYVKEMEGKGFKNAQKIYDAAVELSAKFQKEVGK
jgi:TRAP-type C4-dicarboxylate transport system substrate-binding protein